MTDGLSLCHRIQQMDYGYYVYDRSNWASANQDTWITREINAFRADLIPELQDSLSDTDVTALKTFKMAAVGISYFLLLAASYEAKMPSFNKTSYFEAATKIIKKRYLTGLSCNHNSLGEMCQSTADSWISIIEILGSILAPRLNHGEELARFLSPRTHSPQSMHSSDLIDAYRERHSSWHHVSI